ILIEYQKRSYSLKINALSESKDNLNNECKNLSQKLTNIEQDIEKFCKEKEKILKLINNIN
ncbi:hypothetical protein, partial [Sphaerospermopsis aphanizomenoides]|uniref:hypothetical protein n=1 Tax=Sphaerospermopsis aphanizomenoides TaxID=459663 RepID=UPI001F235E2C